MGSRRSFSKQKTKNRCTYCVRHEWHRAFSVISFRKFFSRLQFFFMKIENFELKVLILSEFTGKIVILSTHSLCRISLALSVRKIATFCLPNYFNL